VEGSLDRENGEILRKNEENVKCKMKEI